MRRRSTGRVYRCCFHVGSLLFARDNYSRTNTIPCRIFRFEQYLSRTVPKSTPICSINKPRAPPWRHPPERTQRRSVAANASTGPRRKLERHDIPSLHHPLSASQNSGRAAPHTGRGRIRRPKTYADDNQGTRRAADCRTRITELLTFFYEHMTDRGDDPLLALPGSYKYPFGS